MLEAPAPANQGSKLNVQYGKSGEIFPWESVIQQDKSLEIGQCAFRTCIGDKSVIVFF